MNLHSKETKIEPRPLDLKTFGNIFGLKNYYSKRNLYNQYLELAGKSQSMKLTTVDLFKIDQIRL